MLEIQKIDKYFHKGKKNQIHVINQTTITLPDHGLVALLGPSGCGKTTLLNVIGGLDKVKKGSIYVNGQKMTSRRIGKVDKIRNLNIGYIFQDYKLIDHLSVYENVAFVLKMIGIKDKKEIKNRVEYVLEKVGMLRYQKRPASMLSGGERQRVGIARAIVKDPSIILADEPTGNLDSKNTLEIMNIIKAISRDRLVLLVTHEQNLAKFYATRILEIEDGTIQKDYVNEHDEELDYEIENCFYLKDFKEQILLKDQDIDIQLYENSRENVSLTVVVKNGNIYIQSNTNQKIEVVEDTSSIEFIDDHYQKMNQEKALQYHFEFQDKINPNQSLKYSSIINFPQMIVNGFQKVFHFPILKKILLVGFFLAGMFIMYSVSSMAASLHIKEEDFVQVNQNYLQVKQGKIKLNDYLEYENTSSVQYLLPGNSIVSFQLPFNDYYQSNRTSGILKGSLSSIEMIQEQDLIYGRMPVNDYEIVVDNMAIENMLKENDSFQMIGIVHTEDLLNRVVQIKNMNDFTIVGIVSKKSPSIYTAPSLFINLLANTKNTNEISYYNMVQDSSLDSSNSQIMDYHLYQDKIELKKGRMPTNDYEVIVSINNEQAMPLNKQIDVKINDTKLTVVGYYSSQYNDSYYFVNSNMIKYQIILNSKMITVNPVNKEEAITYFQDKNLNIQDSYEKSREDYIKSRNEEIKSTLLVSGIILMISFIEIFLMIRSSFLSRIKEIGIYRAIGVKRSDIYKMFAGEIFAITILAGIPGLLFMAYILNILSHIKYLSNYIMITPSIVGFSILLLFVFNSLVGLIPVFNTIKKRPAEILSRYDLD